MCICNMDPSSDLLRRSQTMCICNMDPSSDLLRRSQTTIPYIREVGLLGGRILDICFDLGQNGWHNRSLALCP